MPPTAAQKGSLCHRVCAALCQCGPKFKRRSNWKDANPSEHEANNTQNSTLAPGTSSPSSGPGAPLGPNRDARERSATIKDEVIELDSEKATVVSVIRHDFSLDSPAFSVEKGGPEPPGAPSDLWSAAYREAVASLGDDINTAILRGNSVAELFEQLEKIDKDAREESLFRRGVNYLKTLQIPLESFKLALDLASPLLSIEPTVSTVFGVVKNVTAIAISLANADAAFAERIGEMLKQLSYIDDCDTLGQKSNKKDIHKALVVVYQKLLEFYISAFEMLSKGGVRLALGLVMENGRLPAIVDDFLKHAEHLHKLVLNATMEIAEDIKTMLYDQEIARWLGGEKMTRQTQHHVSMCELREDRACDFLLTDAMFINWHDPIGSQHLAILGHMGSGKTVAMSFLIEELRKRYLGRWPQPKICYHYCGDNETGQPVYVFSALILSLLAQLPGLKKTFVNWYKETIASGVDPATSFRTLEEWMQTTLDTLDRPLVLAIDGLDECDRYSRSLLITSLKTLTQRTPRLKILLASRPEGELLEQLSGMNKILLVPNVARDRLIVQKTVETRLSYLAPDVKALVTETLARRAEGSAIWTKMTVGFIEIRGITALGPMRTFLNETPQPKQLSQLYYNLFARLTSDEPENQRLAATALEVLAVTRRPLSILELAWAAALGTARTTASVDALASLEDRTRVLKLISPFVARLDFNDVRKRQVKLVHQSVKEFILLLFGPDQSGPQDPATSAPLPTLSEELVRRRTESLEASILDICIRYLLLRDIGEVALFSPEYLAIEELPQDASLFCDDDEVNDYDITCSWEVWEQNMIRYDPTERGFGELFVFASCYFTEYFGAVSTDLLRPRLDDIEELCRAGSMRLGNWSAQNCRPDCALKPRFDFGDVHDPLTVTAVYGSEAMLLQVLEYSDVDSERFLPNSAMAAADLVIQVGDLPRVGMIWGSKLGRRIWNLDLFRLAVRQWSRSASDRRRPGWDVVFDLINDVLDTMVKERWGHDLLALAVRENCMPVIQRLMEKSQHQPALKNELLDRPSAESRLIADAVLANHADVVEYLAGQQGIEAHLRYRNARGENVLHLASQFCNPAVFQQLVPHLKDCVHETDDQGYTVLKRILVSPLSPRARDEAGWVLLSGVRGSQDGRFRAELHETLDIITKADDPAMDRLRGIVMELLSNQRG